MSKLQRYWVRTENMSIDIKGLGPGIESAMIDQAFYAADVDAELDRLRRALQWVSSLIEWSDDGSVGGVPIAVPTEFADLIKPRQSP